jgi:hypothetical protein
MHHGPCSSVRIFPILAFNLSEWGEWGKHISIGHI